MATKTCKSWVKDDTGKKVVCGTPVPRGSCPKRNQHIMKYPTGFCASGFHEGTRAHDAAGKAAVVCLHWKECPCSCHSDIDSLFAMTGQLRVSQENPEYITPKSPYWVPSLEERAMLHASSNSGGSNDPIKEESPLPDAIPATVRRAFAPTPTGRAGRGQLETWVKEACDEWIVEEYKDFCSPSWVASWIVSNKGVPTQSQGAVDAVFVRWTKIGFARVEKKPTRFLGYTEDGIKLGLDALKLRFKESGKRAKSVNARVLR